METVEQDLKDIKEFLITQLKEKHPDSYKNILENLEGKQDDNSK